MFLFFILMLFLAVLTENSNNSIVDEKIVAKEIEKENELTNKIVLEETLKK